MKDHLKVQMGKNSRKQGKAFELRVRKDLESKGWIVCKWQNNVEFQTVFSSKNLTKDKIDNLIKDIKKNKVEVLMTDSNVETQLYGKLISAKHTFNPFTKAMSAGNGFPDFVCFNSSLNFGRDVLFRLMLVESKMNGKLDKLEKQKIEWIKNNLKIPVMIASKDGRKIKYEYEIEGYEKY